MIGNFKETLFSNRIKVSIIRDDDDDNDDNDNDDENDDNDDENDDDDHDNDQTGKAPPWKNGYELFDTNICAKNCYQLVIDVTA